MTAPNTHLDQIRKHLVAAGAVADDLERQIAALQAGDLNLDGAVDLADLAILQQHLTGPAEPPPPDDPEPADRPPDTQAGSREPIADWTLPPFTPLEPGRGRVTVTCGHVAGVWGAVFDFGRETVTVRPDRFAAPVVYAARLACVLPADLPTGIHEVGVTVFGIDGGRAQLTLPVRVGAAALPAGVHWLRGLEFTRPDTPPDGTVIYEDCTWRTAGMGYNRTNPLLYAVGCRIVYCPGRAFRALQLAEDCDVLGSVDDAFQNCRTIVDCIAVDLDPQESGLHCDAIQQFYGGDQQIVDGFGADRCHYQLAHSSKGYGIGRVLWNNVRLSAAAPYRRADGKCPALLQSDMGHAVFVGVRADQPFYVDGRIGAGRFDVTAPAWRGPERV